MGNDHSQMSGMDVEEKAVEVTDFWSHHTATISAGSAATVSVFISEPLLATSLWVSQTPLERASKNFMLHRHPCILKYISSWSKSSKYYLAVEDVKPLSHHLPKQSTLQLCVGLHSILKALIFLHETACASHNNLCITSIYITKDGSWKLGGLEYLCKFKDMTMEYMSRSRGYRYNKAVDPNEDKNLVNAKNRLDSVDVYAFATLVGEVLKKQTDDAVPSLVDFLELCKSELQNVAVAKRPKLSDLLEHPFFNHEFIYIHSFLTELPLKSDTERSDFFSTLVEKLRSFNETTVASQLGGLLLSRMVLLNKSAQSDVIPMILNPKKDIEGSALFTVDTFKSYLVPKLLDIFCVRDAQIRLLLLEYFNNFMECFTKDELQSQILPELLVGVKDTNDYLVAVTLRALADLIPVLGSATVIGGNRGKLFNDGRPITHPIKSKSRRNSARRDVGQIPDAEMLVSLELPERPSPDGEEDETSTDEVEITAEEEEEAEAWDDWEINEEEEAVDQDFVINPPDVALQNSQPQVLSTVQKKQLPDIMELDIKNQKDAHGKDDEIDFFLDMEPVIETSTKFVTGGNEERGVVLDLSVSNLDVHEEGWGDELDWED